MNNTPLTLLTMPSEVKRLIWQLVLTNPDPIILRYKNHQWVHPKGSTPSITPISLLQTCKQIYNEAGLVYYNVNNFELHPRTATVLHVDVARFHRRMREDQFQALRSVTLVCGMSLLPSNLAQAVEVASQRLSTIRVTPAFRMRFELDGQAFVGHAHTEVFEIAPVDHYRNLEACIVAKLDEDQKKVDKETFRWRVLDEAKTQTRADWHHPTDRLW